ncbi:hypothetical protein ACFFMN_33700 [Planobispora siamensis]|uniref:Uncharacterized protein n=1 Tax=Planobispora siamensis TaxID=936338 RepID=A0A8J3SES8_9ACTN|nr:hypothetical protein [Planobispora siamensis]GIH91994.1 hypothetical protein Psi01_26240 [Planobispora siamensis]
MPGTFRFRRLADPDLFDDLEAPALIIYRPGRIRVRVDAREIAAGVDLLRQLERMADDLMAPFHQLAERHGSGPIGVVNRVRRLPGGRLVAAEYIDGVACIEVVRAAMSEDAAAALAVAGSDLGHYLIPR